MNEEQNIEVVKQGYEAFGKGDIPTLLDIFDENIEWRSPNVENAPYSGNYDGREATGQFFAELDAAEEFTEFEPREFIARDDKVIVLGKTTANIRDTGNEYKTDWVHIFTIRNGKVTNFLEFFDTAAASKAFQKAVAA